jgi:hypothetical protein
MSGARFTVSTFVRQFVLVADLLFSGLMSLERTVSSTAVSRDHISAFGMEEVLRMSIPCFVTEMFPDAGL